MNNAPLYYIEMAVGAIFAILALIQIITGKVVVNRKKVEGCTLESIKAFARKSGIMQFIAGSSLVVYACIRLYTNLVSQENSYSTSLIVFAIILLYSFSERIFSGALEKK